MKTLRMIKVVE